jgi:phage/plasmid-like protein (TIGR03299 family)
MAALVESMFSSGGIVPWHGLGKVIPQDVPAAEAIVCAGLDWTVSKQPVSIPGGKEATEYRAIVRDRDQSILSIQGKEYTPFQNDALFAFGEALVGTSRALFHTAGSLDGGRRVWALMKADGLIEVIKGDAIEKYIMLATSHDGSLAFTSAFTATRIVCANTLNLALSQAKDKVSVRHTTNLQDRVKQAQQIMGLSSVYFDRFKEVAQTLVKTRYTDPQMVELTESLFPVKEGKDEVPTRTLNNRAKVVELFTTGRGHGPIRGTAFAALNAVTEYSDHHASSRNTDRGSAQENKMSSIFWGGAAKLRQQALEVIGEQTGLKLAA